MTTMNPREPVPTRIAIRELQGQYNRQLAVVLPLRQLMRDLRVQQKTLRNVLRGLQTVRGWRTNPDHIQALKDERTLTERVVARGRELHDENHKLAVIKQLIQDAEVDHLRYFATRNNPQHATLCEDHRKTETLLEGIDDEIDELNSRLHKLQDARLTYRGVFTNQRIALKKAVKEWVQARAAKTSENRMVKSLQMHTVRKTIVTIP